MSRFRHSLAARDAHIATLRAFIAVLILACAGMWYGWKSAPQDLTIHNPPDLRTGSTRKWWVVPPSTAYAFGFYIWQQINRWPKNGKLDYKANIDRYSEYLTPSCRRKLKADYRQRVQRGELLDRVRALQEIPDNGYEPDDVMILARNAWIVRLDAEINETLYATPVRNLYIRYFLRVVRRDVDPEQNPFGLMLDCFAKPALELAMPDKAKDDAK